MIHYVMKVHKFEHDIRMILLFSIYVYYNYYISKKQNNNHAFPEATNTKKGLNTIRHSSV